VSTTPQHRADLFVDPASARAKAAHSDTWLKADVGLSAMTWPKKIRPEKGLPSIWVRGTSAAVR
jgi:hypothetical protein